MSDNEIVKQSGITVLGNSEYSTLVDNISSLWDSAKSKAAVAINTELLEANWRTGQYIVEFEQNGNARAEYGKNLINTLARDLTVLRGRGFSKSNLLYMRKLYLTFPKSETLSHLLSWSHYFEILKCDDNLEMLFYYNACIKERWTVRGLKRQMKSALYLRLALSTDKEGILLLAKEGVSIQKPQDIIRDPFGLYNTHKDIDALIRGIQRIQGMF